MVCSFVDFTEPGLQTSVSNASCYGSGQTNVAEDTADLQRRITLVPKMTGQDWLPAVLRTTSTGTGSLKANEGTATTTSM